MATLEQSVKNLEKYTVEYRIVLPDGEIRYIQDQGEIVQDELGEPTHAFGTAQDITERKLAELALSESETLYRNILENIVDTYYRTNTEGEIVMASPSVLQLVGYSAEEVIGRRLTDFYIDPNGRELFLSAFRESGGNVHGYEAALRRKDGTTIWVSNNARTWTDENGNVLGVEGVSRVITERRLANDALLESEARLLEAQRIGHIGSWEHHFVVDHYSKDTLIWSDETYRIFGLDPAVDTATAELFFSLVHPDDRAQNKAAFDVAISGDGKFYNDRRIVLRNGDIQYVQERGEIVFDDAGLPVRSFGTVQDTTEQKVAEAELQTSEQKFSGIMANVADSVITIDKTGTILSFNKSAEKTFGYSADEVIGSGVEMLMSNPHRAKHKDYLSAYLASGESAILGKGPREFEGLRKGGESFPLELSISEAKIGERQTFIGAIRDTTNRKRIEDDLRFSEFRLSEAQRIAGLGNWVWDLKKRRCLLIRRTLQDIWACAG